METPEPCVFNGLTLLILFAPLAVGYALGRWDQWQRQRDAERMADVERRLRESVTSGWSSEDASPAADLAAEVRRLRDENGAPGRPVERPGNGVESGDSPAEEW